MVVPSVEERGLLGGKDTVGTNRREEIDSIIAVISTASDRAKLPVGHKTDSSSPKFSPGRQPSGGRENPDWSVPRGFPVIRRLRQFCRQAIFLLRLGYRIAWLRSTRASDFRTLRRPSLRLSLSARRLCFGYCDATMRLSVRRRYDSYCQKTIFNGHLNGKHRKALRQRRRPLARFIPSRTCGKGSRESAAPVTGMGSLWTPSAERRMPGYQPHGDFHRRPRTTFRPDVDVCARAHYYSTELVSKNNLARHKRLNHSAGPTICRQWDCPHYHLRSVSYAYRSPDHSLAPRSRPRRGNELDTWRPTGRL